LLTRDEFTQHIKDALAGYYNPVRLQVSPLVNLFALSKFSGETGATRLRETLRDAIDALSPPSSVPVSAIEWLGYRLLWSRYIQSRGRQVICDELGLSQASYYRYHQQAVEAVAAILWERHQPQILTASLVGSQEQVSSLQALAREEAVRLALDAERWAVPLDGLLASIRETILPLAEQQGVPLNIEAPPCLPLVYGDPSILRQIVLNVLTEAMTATPDDLSLVVMPHGDEVLWQLKGLAITRATEESERVSGFDLSRELVQVYGGRFWLEQDDQGWLSLFWTMPLAHTASILIIDDDDDTIALYQRYLCEHDYVIQVARQREELEALLAESTPALILLDVLMPRWDGWLILQQLKMRPETTSIPVVICSVLSQPELALALGATEVLQKPISEQSLLQTVGAVLARADSAA